jgi:sigma-E factor negative regulatory protein RseC
MIEETAVVIEKSKSQVTLEIERRSACAICGQTRGCGNATWGKMLGHQQHAIQAVNAIDANVGDRVVVGIQERAVLNAAYLLYFLPLLALFIGAGIASVLFRHDFYVILGAILGLLFGFFGVKQYVNRHQAPVSSDLNASRQSYAVILRFSNESLN